MRRRVIGCLLMLRSKMSFYAVRKGRNPGVYQTWAQCQEQVAKFTGAKFRKFSTEAEAWEFVNEDAGMSSSNSYSQGSVLGSSDNGLQFKIQAIMSTMNLFKQQLTSLSSLGDKLSTEIEDLQCAVGLRSGGLSPAKSYTPGVKRAFTTGTRSGQFGPQPPKKSNLRKTKSQDSTPEYWTGKKFNEEDGVTVYTDGACGDNGRNGARAGLGVFWGEGDSRNLSERLPGRPTNNRAEIHAARRAVEQAKAYGIKNLILHTDSQFLINSITTWIKGWKKNDWVKTTGEPVINKEDFLQLDRVIQDMNIKWVYVKGHHGIPGNEAADRLATEGAKKPQPCS
ncbi:ribonuclease H1-like [Liolophura sinensis]|uniref:ribonuclease H1-like n=1 Tax=Liolophura sinensis TaxID=3198878 RepID=UPI0031580238